MSRRREPSPGEADAQPSLFDTFEESAPKKPAGSAARPARTQRAKSPASSPAGSKPRAKAAATRSPSGPEVLAVGEFTRRLAAQLKGLGRVAVEGEITGLKRAGSGHVYFGLKDGDAYLSCAIWRSRVDSAVRFPLAEGMRVVAHGSMDLYAPRGSYSLIVDRVERRGIGELLAQLEELKAELKAEGWFDRRRNWAPMPRKIGVVTSRDSAGFQDFLRTRSLRWPGYPLRLAHTSVQGRGASTNIAAAIRKLDASGVDVICVVRGGGSLEDLWCFNERPVAEAIWECSVPVVSGVGHETDVTLADLVADHRAHTPTDAAQTVLPDQAELLQKLERMGAYLLQSIDGHLQTRTERLERCARARVLRRPEAILDRRSEALQRLSRSLLQWGQRGLAPRIQKLDQLAVRLARRSPERRLDELAAQLERSASRLHPAAQRALEKRERRLDLADRTLQAISPFAVLERGYSITRRSDGRALRSTDEIAAGESILTLLARGSVLAEVSEVRPEEPADGDA